MSGRQKLPTYIVVLNIIMVVILLAICGLVFALTMASKDIGWDLPVPDSTSEVSQQAAAGKTESAADGVSGEVTVTAEAADTAEAAE